MSGLDRPAEGAAHNTGMRTSKSSSSDRADTRPDTPISLAEPAPPEVENDAPPWTSRLAQCVGAITVLWAASLILLGWLAPGWEGAASSAISFAWKALINVIWVGFGIAVIQRQRFSTFLLFYVHGASAALLAGFALIPGRWSFGMRWTEWTLYVIVPGVCATLLAPDVVWRWRKLQRED